MIGSFLPVPVAGRGGKPQARLFGLPKSWLGQKIRALVGGYPSGIAFAYIDPGDFL